MLDKSVWSIKSKMTFSVKKSSALWQVVLGGKSGAGVGELVSQAFKITRPVYKHPKKSPANSSALIIGNTAPPTPPTTPTTPAVSSLH